MLGMREIGKSDLQAHGIAIGDGWSPRAVGGGAFTGVGMIEEGGSPIGSGIQGQATGIDVREVQLTRIIAQTACPTRYINNFNYHSHSFKAKLNFSA